MRGSSRFLWQPSAIFENESKVGLQIISDLDGLANGGVIRPIRPRQDNQLLGNWFNACDRTV
jgi:hypothetical protein